MESSNTLHLRGVKMNLSKSRYCEAIQCNKMLWLDINYPNLKMNVDNSSTLDTGTEVGILAKDLFGQHVDIEFDKNLQSMVDKTKKVLEKEKKVIVTEASFLYKNNFCSVDILIKNNDKYEIYEVKSSTEVKDIYIDDISYQTYVLKHLGFNVVKSSLIYLNHFYKRHGELDLKKLFVIEDVTNKVLEKQDEVEDKIKEINSYMKKTEVNDDIGLQCVKPYDCPFFEYCTRNLEKPNLFTIKGMRYNKKISFYKNGIYTYKDLLKEDIDEKSREQIEFELYDKKDKINKYKIREFLKTLSYPLYFLDFETFQQSIPMYDNIRPNEKIPFQYSLHYIETEFGKLKHKEFLAETGVDPRRSLAERLVEDIPLNVCTLAYNMGFEKSVIKNLATLYPDLEHHLMNIHDNIKDLMIPFLNRDYYSKEMYGSYSIKYVSPALFPDDQSLNYHNLEDVHNGGEAMDTFKNLEKLSKEEQEKLRQSLLKYCELDTYSMVKIYEKLKKI